MNRYSLLEDKNFIDILKSSDDWMDAILNLENYYEKHDENIVESAIALYFSKKNEEIKGA